MARVEPDFPAVPDLHPALSTHRDNVLPASHRVPVGKVVGTPRRELEPREVDTRAARRLVLLGVNAAIRVRVDPRHLDQTALLLRRARVAGPGNPTSAWVGSHPSAASQAATLRPRPITRYPPRATVATMAASCEREAGYIDVSHAAGITLALPGPGGARLRATVRLGCEARRLRTFPRLSFLRRSTEPSALGPVHRKLFVARSVPMMPACSRENLGGGGDRASGR